MHLKEGLSQDILQRILIISDNTEIASRVYKIINLFHSKLIANIEWASTIPIAIEIPLKKINIKNGKHVNFIIKNYDLIISAHCRQVFPRKLVENVRCINIHPGYNPYNRGWYPHVFSIINNLPAGATIHEINEKIDDGPIIDRIRVKIDELDDSLSLYKKVLDAEEILFKKNFKRIVNGKYKTFYAGRGNYNSKKDYQKLLQMDLSKKNSLNEKLKLLRALTHPPYKNAFFVNNAGRKVYLEVVFSK